MRYLHHTQPKGQRLSRKRRQKFRQELLKINQSTGYHCLQRGLRSFEWKWPPNAHIFEYFVSSCSGSFGEYQLLPSLQRYVIVGGLEDSKAHASPVSPFLCFQHTGRILAFSYCSSIMPVGFWPFPPSLWLWTHTVKLYTSTSLNYFCYNLPWT